MAFFETPEPLPPPPEEQRQPEWAGPPDNVLGAAVPIRLVIARSENAVIAVTDASAYPTGIEFRLVMRVRKVSHETRRSLMHGDPFHLHRFRRDEPAEGLPPELLRFGVQFADGRKATTLGARGWSHDREPDAPILTFRGGGGGDRSWDMRIWLWPLPPPGPLAFVAEWPIAGIPETRVETGAEPFAEAAARAELLWPEGRTLPGGNSRTHYLFSRTEETSADAPPASSS
jgi:hypothetical protein